jgi:hypothetical protein
MYRSSLVALSLVACHGSVSPSGDASCTVPTKIDDIGDSVSDAEATAPSIREKAVDASVLAVDDDASTDDTDAGEGAPPCQKPAVTDPCDCRFAIEECGGYTCGIGAACELDSGTDGPFWFDDQACIVVHRSNGVGDCDTLSDGVRCCNGTQSQ